jgi:hypothetical protein
MKTAKNKLEKLIKFARARIISRPFLFNQNQIRTMQTQIRMALFLRVGGKSAGNKRNLGGQRKKFIEQNF